MLLLWYNEARWDWLSARLVCQSANRLLGVCMGGRGLVREGGQSALIGFWEIRATLVVNERRCCDPVLLRLSLITNRI